MYAWSNEALGVVNLEANSDSSIEDAVLVGDGDVVVLAFSVDNVASSLGRGVLKSALGVVDAVGRASLGPVEVLSSVVDTNIELVSRLGATVGNEVLDGGASTDVEALVDYSVNQSVSAVREAGESVKFCRECSR